MPSARRFSLRMVSFSLGLVGRPAAAQAEACGESFIRTYDIQGSDDESPYLGQTVAVEAVVTADFRGVPDSLGDLDGVFVQDPQGDATPATSDGLFLYFGASPMLRAHDAFAPGTWLRAWGVVQEYEGETQLRASGAQPCATNLPLVPSLLDLASSPPRSSSTGWLGDLEAQEGMVLTTAVPLRVADIGAYPRHGELTLIEGAVPWAFTHDNSPDVEAFTRYEQSIAQRTVVLDDGSNSEYPELGAFDPSLRIGSEWQTPSAFVVRAPRQHADGNRGAYRIEPLRKPLWTSSETLTAQVPPPATPSALRVVAVNLHNLFKDVGAGAACYPSFDAQDCRGPSSVAARDAHWRESARQVATWDADVIAASEVQNDFGAGAEPTWVRWVAELNAAAIEAGTRCGNYLPVVPAGYHGGDAIAVALAYCAESLVLDSFEGPEPSAVDAWGAGVFEGPNSSRLPLAATWTRRADRRSLAVVVNHFKSRSPGALPEQCPNPRLPDCDARDGQGYFNDARVRAASALTDWLSERPFARGQVVVVAGDLNAYGREAPLAVLGAAGFQLLTDADSTLQPSYAYDSRLGVLDHLLISDQHVALVSAVGVLGKNVGMPPTGSVFSDHDAVFADVSLEATPTCDCATSGAIVGSPDADVLWGTTGSDVICGLGGDDVLFGLGGKDCIDGGLGRDWALVPAGEMHAASVYAEYPIDEATGARMCQQ